MLVFLCSSLGYLVGTLVQLSKLFIVVLPVVIFGFEITSSIYPLIPIGEFYFQEQSFIVFLVKVLITIAILFSVTGILSNRMEVRR